MTFKRCWTTRSVIRSWKLGFGPQSRSLLRSRRYTLASPKTTSHLLQQRARRSDKGEVVRTILLPGTGVNRARGRPGRLHSPPAPIPVVAIPEKRGMLVVVRHRVPSNIRAEYNLCCIRRYTASSPSIAKHPITRTSEKLELPRTPCLRSSQNSPSTHSGE
jgi:hypothetical protein